MLRTLSLVAVAVALSACAPIEPSPEPLAPLEGLTLTLITDDLEEPAALASPPRDDRVFVVERAGRVRVVEDGVLADSPAIDLTGEIDARGEKGLTGLAFHPEFGRNRLAYLLYNDLEGNSRLVEYRMSAMNSNEFDASTARLVLELEQTDFYHQGGYIVFGPAGYLWVTFGDGGNARDPEGHGQNPHTLHGTVLRLDIDSARPYAIPSDNPFSDGLEGAPEVWAFGLRNPWRIAIDADARIVYVADVGQWTAEEINVVPLDEPGANFGWSTLEGDRCFHLVNCREMGLADGVTSAAVIYGREEGCAVIGGHVYRGRAIPELRGDYLYGDHCLGWIKSLSGAGSGEIVITDWTEDLGAVTSLMSFGTDADGEIYVLQRGGRVYRIDPLRAEPPA